jgi:hypothetical protein
MENALERMVPRRGRASDRRGGGPTADGLDLDLRWKSVSGVRHPNRSRKITHGPRRK